MTLTKMKFLCQTSVNGPVLMPLDHVGKCRTGGGANIEVLRLVIQINGQVQTANCKLMGVGLSGKWVAASCEPQT